MILISYEQVLAVFLSNIYFKRMYHYSHNGKLKIYKLTIGLIISICYDGKPIESEIRLIQKHDKTQL